MKHTIFALLSKGYMALAIFISAQVLSHVSITFGDEGCRPKQALHEKDSRGFKFIQNLPFGKFSYFTFEKGWTNETSWKMGWPESEQGFCMHPFYKVWVKLEQDKMYWKGL